MVRDGDGCIASRLAASGERSRLVTLKRRAEFLRLRGGRRSAERAFVLETKPQVVVAGEVSGASGPRFGFTVTKALGNAVIRNRIRRRLKAVVRTAALDRAVSGHDYVIIARGPALDLPFAELTRQVERALAAVHRPGRAPGTPETRASGPEASRSPHRRGKARA